MKRKEYIEKMANLIVNRVRFHAPIVYDGEVDFAILEIIGLDMTLPIFKYEKALSPLMFEAFKKAQEEVEFNLIVTIKPKCNERKLSSLRHFVYIREEELGYALLSSINALNINYKSGSKFTKDIEEDYIKVNDEIVNLNYKSFYLHKKAVSDGVTFEIKEFLLSGKNFLLSFTNPHKEKKISTFEINIVLPHGYYYFKREPSAIKVTNLTSKEVAYFNFQSKSAHFSFSTISGVESSTHACINMKISLNLSPLEQKRFFFSFGNVKYCLTPKQAEEFFKLSQDKIFESFNVKVLTRDKNFDEEFNNLLPQKIWLAWLNFSNDFESEERYIKLRESIVKKLPNGYAINEENKGIKQVQLYRNSRFVKIFIVPGLQRFILADKTKFFNFNLVANEFFNKNNEIYLSFGS